MGTDHNLLFGVLALQADLIDAAQFAEACAAWTARKDRSPAERAGSAEAWARFLEEARITGQLEHPGIVPVYELARRPETGQPFYTMRFVKGRTLTAAAAAYHEKRAAGAAGPLDLHALLQAF